MGKHIGSLKRSLRWVWRISRALGIAIVGAVIVYTCIIEFSTLEAQSMVHDTYMQSSSHNVYMDENLDEEAQLTKVNNVIKKLPKGQCNILEKDWVILISKSCPFDSFITEGTVMGTTYYSTNIIWMHPEFSEKELAHEFGHMFSFYCGEICKSKEFKNIYLKCWNYVEADKTVVDSHCVSSSSEFFAEMFAEYLYYPESLKAGASECYSFIDDARSDAWRLSFLGEYHGIANRMFRIVGEKFVSFGKGIAYKYKNTSNNAAVLFHKNIVLNDTLGTNTYQYQETETIVALAKDIVANPDNYDDEITHRFNYDVDFNAYLEMQAVLSFYFMDTRESFVKMGVEYNNGIVTPIILNKEQLLIAEQKRNESLTKVEEVIPTLKDGSEEQILIQVADYILDNCEYGLIYESACSEQFWNGTGNDKTYAMIFQQFAHRLGFECDIVMSPFENGVDRVFNRVKLSDGTYRYFDLSRYELNVINVKEPDVIIYSVNILYY